MDALTGGPDNSAGDSRADVDALPPHMGWPEAFLRLGQHLLLVAGATALALRNEIPGTWAFGAIVAATIPAARRLIVRRIAKLTDKG